MNKLTPSCARPKVFALRLVLIGTVVWPVMLVLFANDTRILRFSYCRIATLVAMEAGTLWRRSEEPLDTELWT